MLGWAKGFLAIALFAAAFGFTSLAGAASDIAQVIFWVFLALTAAAMVAGAARGQPPPVAEPDQR